MARQVNTTYGSALFEVAMETNTLDSTLEEVTFVKQTFLENEDLMKLLLHPNIEKENKISVVENIYKGKISDEITGLLTMLINKGTSERDHLRSRLCYQQPSRKKRELVLPAFLPRWSFQRNRRLR